VVGEKVVRLSFVHRSFVVGSFVRSFVHRRRRSPFVRSFAVATTFVVSSPKAVTE